VYIIYTMSNFDYIADPNKRIILELGFNAVTELELWGWLKNKYNEDNPNMFMLNAIFDFIDKQIKMTTNEFQDLNIIFREVISHLKYIAVHGEIVFKNAYLFKLKQQYERDTEKNQHLYNFDNIYILARL